MKANEIAGRKKEILEKTDALLTGHFKLTSGLHSPNYFQCAKIFQYPNYTEEISKDIAKQFSDSKITVCAAPAVGGIIIGYEIARALSCRTIFAERVDGNMQLRRGFEIAKDDRMLIVEDVVTTGGSILEIAQIAKQSGAEIIGYSSVLNRSMGRFAPQEPYIPWLSLEIETFEPNDCPLCKSGVPLYQPGSRNLAK